MNTWTFANFLMSSLLAWVFTAGVSGNVLCRNTSECSASEYCDTTINMCEKCDYLCITRGDRKACEILCKDVYIKTYEALTSARPIVAEQIGNFNKQADGQRRQSLFQTPYFIVIYAIAGALILFAVLGSIVIVHNRCRSRSDIQQPTDRDAEQELELITMKEVDYHGSKDKIALE